MQRTRGSLGQNVRQASFGHVFTAAAGVGAGTGAIAGAAGAGYDSADQTVSQTFCIIRPYNSSSKAALSVLRKRRECLKILELLM